MMQLDVVATQVVESPHPYLDSQDLTHPIKPADERICSSIECMEVVFDTRCRTESNCDYVTFWKDGVRQGAQKYHGHSPGVWAGVGAQEILTVTGSSMEARFHSDGSNNDWGYKFTVSFLAKPAITLTPFHNVVNPTLSYLPLAVFVQFGFLHHASIPQFLCQSFGSCLRVAARQSDFNFDPLLSGGNVDTIVGYLSIPLLMRSLGYIDAAPAHTLFAKLYLLACARQEQLFVPPPGASNDMILEIGAVLSEHLSDAKLRSMIEALFIKATGIYASPSPLSTMFFAILASALDISSRSLSPESTKNKIVGCCSNQHPLMLCSSVPLAVMRTSNGWTCSICNASIPSFQTGIWYCEICSYVPITYDHRFYSRLPCSFSVCPGCQPRYMSVRARETFQVGHVVMLIPAEMGNYRDHTDAAGGPLVLGQQEPIEQVSDNRIRSAAASASASKLLFE
jgi:hypothetical protein